MWFKLELNKLRIPWQMGADRLKVRIHTKLTGSNEQCPDELIIEYRKMQLTQRSQSGFHRG